MKNRIVCGCVCVCVCVCVRARANREENVVGYPLLVPIHLVLLQMMSYSLIVHDHFGQLDGNCVLSFIKIFST